MKQFEFNKEQIQTIADEVERRVQIVFSNDPADYNAKEHADWSIDAPANGGMVKINLTVNYSFKADRVIDIYTRFNGMDGEQLVETYIQNSIIAYVKEVTPKFSVMDIYSDKKSEVNKALTEYLNEKLSDEYGIQITSALIIDVELDTGLQDKIKAKEQAKQCVSFCARWNTPQPLNSRRIRRYHTGAAVTRA